MKPEAPRVNVNPLTSTIYTEYTEKTNATGKLGVGDVGLFYLVKPRSDGFVDARYQMPVLTSKPNFIKAQVDEMASDMKSEQRRMEKAVAHRDRLVLEFAQGGKDGKAIKTHLKGLLAQEVDFSRINWGLGALRENDSSLKPHTADQVRSDIENVAKAAHKGIVALLDTWEDKEKAASTEKVVDIETSKSAEKKEGFWTTSEPKKSKSKPFVANEDRKKVLVLLRDGLAKSLADRGISVAASPALSSNSSADTRPSDYKARSRSVAVGRDDKPVPFGKSVPASTTTTTTTATGAKTTTSTTGNATRPIPVPQDALQTLDEESSGSGSNDVL
ncbi:MAG: hypothetical protein Q7T87_22120 [Polaromonas sp.]|nr:hypothetical protein [Polaromonas sp.]